MKFAGKAKGIPWNNGVIFSKAAFVLHQRGLIMRTPYSETVTGLPGLRQFGTRLTGAGRRRQASSMGASTRIPKSIRRCSPQTPKSPCQLLTPRGMALLWRALQQEAPSQRRGLSVQPRIPKLPW